LEKLGFIKYTVGVVDNTSDGYPMNTFHTVGDLNNDGLDDIVVSGRKGRMIWLENCGAGNKWIEHLIDGDVDRIGCGGTLVDLTGNGYLDVIVGGGGADEIWWWENPGLTDVQIEGQPWKRRLILKTDRLQFHDILIGNATNDGRKSLIFTNQGRGVGTTICCIPLPADPTDSPWPGIMVVATGKEEKLVGPDGNLVKMQPEEGLALGDVDGDALYEIVAGTWWYKFNGKDWGGHKFADGYVTNKIAIGDLDGDGRNEIVLSEGDPCIYGKTQGGKVSWFKPGPNITDMWHAHVLEDFLLDAHTLAVGDLTGSGALDILVGEIGVASETRGYQGRDPRILVFENDGKANFTRHLIDDGTGIHNGLLADTFNTSKLDLVGKPLHGPERWSIHVYSQIL
jgi:hypothetical protein